MTTKTTTKTTSKATIRAETRYILVNDDGCCFDHAVFPAGTTVNKIIRWASQRGGNYWLAESYESFPIRIWENGVCRKPTKEDF